MKNKYLLIITLFFLSFSSCVEKDVFEYDSVSEKLNKLKTKDSEIWSLVKRQILVTKRKKLIDYSPDVYENLPDTTFIYSVFPKKVLSTYHDGETWTRYEWDGYSEIKLLNNTQLSTTIYDYLEVQQINLDSMQSILDTLKNREFFKLYFNQISKNENILIRNDSDTIMIDYSNVFYSFTLNKKYYYDKIDQTSKLYFANDDTLIVENQDPDRIVRDLKKVKNYYIKKKI